jgi:peptidoglycan/xylan/chitin deacetylase (PgdA/CDA1 family)
MMNKPVVLLTHDIDILSISELPFFSRTFMGLGYRLLIENFIRLKKGNITFKVYLISLFYLFILPFIKLTGRADFIKKSTQKMIDLENYHNVKSTWFFITKNRHPGMVDEYTKAPKNRQAYYQISRYSKFINSLIDNGHEVGVHSLDAHWDIELGREELNILRGITNQNHIGVRSHWLYFNKKLSHKKMAESGFYYDCTPGWNHKIGIPKDDLKVDKVDSSFFIIPTNIQDGALYDESYLGMSFNESRDHITSLLDKLIDDKSVITILWHNNSFDAPRFWGDGYEFIIKYLKSRGCDFMTVKEYIDLQN